MARPNKNRRRPQEKRGGNQSGSAATWAAVLVVGGLSAFGLWRCLDDGTVSLLAPAEGQRSVRVVDVGAGKTADLTLVNERRLLQSEAERAKKATERDEASAKAVDAGPGEDEKDPAKAAAEPAAEALAAPVERFPLHAVAFEFHAQLNAASDPTSRVIAYARRGATFRASQRTAGPGCKKGWHEIAPGKAFFCAGKGVLVDDEPVTFAPAPPSPRIESSLPYAYAYVTVDDTPEYWRAPTPEESATVTSLFEGLRAKKTGDSGAPDGGAAVDPGLPAFVHQRLARGYFVSLDAEVEAEGVSYQRTVRGRLVPAERLAPAKPSEFAGSLVDEQHPLPLAFVVGSGVKILERHALGRLRSGETVSRYSVFRGFGVVDHRGKPYVDIGADRFLPRGAAALASAVTPPADLAADERWIDVDLKEQTLVAYEGARPVFATLVSTGRKGFETPQGSFRIYGKHIAITMDDPQAGAEAYSIEDVPWTQYFKDSYALHTAFWHDRFGRVRSHGCINLSPADARRLFFWTGPHLPAGLHGIVATRDDPGTRVIVHE